MKNNIAINRWMYFSRACFHSISTYIWKPQITRKPLEKYKSVVLNKQFAESKNGTGATVHFKHTSALKINN